MRRRAYEKGLGCCAAITTLPTTADLRAAVACVSPPSGPAAATSRTAADCGRPMRGALHTALGGGATHGLDGIASSARGGPSGHTAHTGGHDRAPRTTLTWRPKAGQHMCPAWQASPPGATPSARRASTACGWGVMAAVVAARAEGMWTPPPPIREPRTPPAHTLVGPGMPRWRIAGQTASGPSPMLHGSRASSLRATPARTHTHTSSRPLSCAQLTSCPRAPMAACDVAAYN